MTYDVAIVGGGPAGRAAALVLGRARVRAVLLDGNAPRSAVAGVMRGFLTRDGASISEFRRIASEELLRYSTVSVRQAQVTRVDGTTDHLELQLERKPALYARRVLLCCGIEDSLPGVPGLREAWGKGAFGCPYCHGWEVRDLCLGYLTPDAEAISFSWLLQSWASRVVLFTDGRVPLTDAARTGLERRAIVIEERPLRAVVARPDGLLVGAEVVGGDLIDCQALFLQPTPQLPELVRSLRPALDEEGAVRVNADMETSLPGVSAAGDLCSHKHGALVAAASGSIAAHALHRALARPMAPR
jgi:thioredoxin reductase